MAIGRADKSDLTMGAYVQTVFGGRKKVRHCIGLFFPIANDIAPIGEGVEAEQGIAPHHGGQNRQWGHHSRGTLAVPLPAAAPNEDLRISAAPPAHEADGHR